MPSFRLATAADLDAIVSLVNAAFQVESFFLASDRTNREQVAQMFDTGEYLLLEDERGTLGTVYFENRGERAYFGMLAVDPAHKGEGLGRILIEAVEDRARQQGCRYMDITIVNLRTELPGFYSRFGYVLGEALPPPAAMRTKIPCHLIRMTKHLTA